MGSFSRILTALMPAMVEKVVAINEVPMMLNGATDLATARTPTAVAGINWIELVLMARQVHIAFVATPGRGFKVSRSFIARIPSGVAAFDRPSMLAARFMRIE